MTQQPPSLQDLRREIDSIDEQVHELLMKRGDIIDRLISVKKTQEVGSAFRPAREADMMRRLVQRHRGMLPLDTVESIWRVIIATFTYVQAPFSVHADLSVGESAMRDSARFHFGFTTPYVAHFSAQAAVESVAKSKGDLALVSAIWLRERFGLLQAAGVVLALAGVLHVLVRGQWGALAEVQLNPGDLWIAVAVLCWTAYSLLLRAWPSAFSPLARLTLIAVAGIVVLLPFTLWEALAWWPSELSWRSAALVLAAALIPGAGAYGAYSIMQRALGAARVSVVLYLGPLYSAVIGWLVLGEPIQVFHAVGAALILPGIWLTTRH